ncbi:MAG: protein-methionine-sulfoxide reductase catalytic subunit MsrP [Candidatus Porifericomitaceae bacterium WSBS_2022_MAG_OTU9]
MPIARPKNLASSEVTPPELYKTFKESRRRFIQAAAAAGVVALSSKTALAAKLKPGARIIEAPDRLYSKNEKGGIYSEDEYTPYDSVTTYNNFYEFGTNKSDPAKHAHKMKVRPWSIEVAGQCNKPGIYDIEDLMAPHMLEERIYRLRCVEAWSMVIPWVGVPTADVLKRFEPNSNAKYVAMTTALQPDNMPGTRRNVLEWPYVEGLRIDEAMNPLTFFAVGLYGKVLPNQNGAPIRLVVPWKYGFKGIKSIVKIEFTEKMPPTSWNISGPREYGFYSNVNPNADHPRWSQAKERRIGEFFKRKTLMFNGYAEQVASMYAGMDLMKNY